MKADVPMVAGEVRAIGGMRLVCMPDYLLTRVGMAGGTVGVLMPPEAADTMVAAMRSAGVASEFAAELARSPPSPGPQEPDPATPQAPTEGEAEK